MSRAFTLLWLGQFVAMTGAGLTEFGFGVWLVQHSDSVSQYTLNTLFALVPGLLVAPLAGSLIDRLPLRRIALAADGGAAAATLCACYLLLSGQLSLPWVYALTACLSVCQAFQMLIYPKAASLLVERAVLGRANGMIQFAYAVSRLIAPAAAGALIAWIALSGVLVLNLLTALFAVLTLCFVAFPAAAPAAPDAPAGRFSDALHWLAGQPALAALMLYTALESFCVGLVMVLVAPLVLANHSESVLGGLMSCAMLGMVLGTALIMLRGAPARLARAIFLADAAIALAIVLIGAAGSLPLLYAAAFVAMAGAGISGACNQTLWQRKVPLALQGRVFALRHIALIGAIPLAALAGGLLADLLTPRLQAGQAFAKLFGPLLGSDAGQGIALTLIVDGLLLGGLAALGFAWRLLRQVDALPEATPADN